LANDRHGGLLHFGNWGGRPRPPEFSGTLLTDDTDKASGAIGFAVEDFCGGLVGGRTANPGPGSSGCWGVIQCRRPLQSIQCAVAWQTHDLTNRMRQWRTHGSAGALLEQSRKAIRPGFRPSFPFLFATTPSVLFSRCSWPSADEAAQRWKWLDRDHVAEGANSKRAAVGVPHDWPQCIGRTTPPKAPQYGEHRDATQAIGLDSQ